MPISNGLMSASKSVTKYVYFNVVPIRHGPAVQLEHPTVFWLTHLIMDNANTLCGSSPVFCHS